MQLPERVVREGDVIVLVKVRYRVSDADAGTITGFLESLLDRWAKSSLFWVVSNFRPFLKFAGRADLVDALSLVGIRRSHPVLSVMADEDVQRVVTACASRTVVSSRDAAITLLALMTGLRSCDIIDLRLGDIDWRSQTISIIQQKTRNPVTLPLPDLLMERLADYVLAARPDTGGDHVFLRELAPHTRLSDHATIHRITTVVFTVAGVTDPRAGSRLLRHTAASRLLAVATALPTISRRYRLGSPTGAVIPGRRLPAGQQPRSPSYSTGTHPDARAPTGQRS